MLTSREFLGNDVYLDWLQDLERMQQFRNEVSKRRPTQDEIMQLKINKAWISFYSKVLQ